MLHGTTCGRWLDCLRWDIVCHYAAFGSRIQLVKSDISAVMGAVEFIRCASSWPSNVSSHTLTGCTARWPERVHKGLVESGCCASMTTIAKGEGFCDSCVNLVGIGEREPTMNLWAMLADQNSEGLGFPPSGQAGPLSVATAAVGGRQGLGSPVLIHLSLGDTFRESLSISPMDMVVGNDLILGWDWISSEPRPVPSLSGWACRPAVMAGAGAAGASPGR
jgi:hypothetical protein